MEEGLVNTSSYGNAPQPMPMMCEKKGCGKPADFSCEPIPGTAYPGWEKEPTARCKEHAKGLIVICDVMQRGRIPGDKHDSQ